MDIKEVDDEVDSHEAHGEDQRGALDERVVAGRERVDGGKAYAWDAEDGSRQRTRDTATSLSPANRPVTRYVL